ncbi:hypothetical protein [Burkholderia territorii]|uniref:hypothetical protein n=1 Tax=Burkholderia territorii TaxID=1503055 RepID=UPI00075F630C|nr:hypothetical protein [Burkholderia territorii]KUZ32983.1 hypothetical protein WS52_05435 [Burkholderia territorii]KUZ53125.1 hypothetical protein WS53_17370 [Burkholderia territorii]
MTNERTELQSIEALRDRIANVSSGLVTFDGCMHVGKSETARRIAHAFGYLALDLDSFLVKQQGVFFQALRLPDFSSALADALSRSQVVLVSGVCMLRVLEAIGLRAALSVYVRRLSPMGIPIDLETTDAEDGAPFAEDYPDIPAIFREVHAYHAKYRPLANADICYKWSSD